MFAAKVRAFSLSRPPLLKPTILSTFDPKPLAALASIYASLCAAAPAKAELSPEAQAALAALPPTERLLADVQAAFEAADVPMSDYTSLDAGGLAGLLPPSVVARSARLFLEENTTRWACRQVVRLSASFLCRRWFSRKLLSVFFSFQKAYTTVSLPALLPLLFLVR